MAASPLLATVAITRSATAARRREVVVVAATPSSAAVAASPPSTAGVITRSATAARRREAELDARTWVSNLARYTEFMREEEVRLVEHAKSLTAAVAVARRLRGEESGYLQGEPPLREGSSGAAEGVRGERS